MTTISFRPNVWPSRLALLAVVLGISLDMLLAGLGHAAPSRQSLQLWNGLLGLAWSWWVFVDRRRLQHGFAFGFDTLVFFVWPIVVPWYLARRGAVSRFGWALYALPIAALIAALSF